MRWTQIVEKREGKESKSSKEQGSSGGRRSSATKTTINKGDLKKLRKEGRKKKSKAWREENS